MQMKPVVNKLTEYGKPVSAMRAHVAAFSQTLRQASSIDSFCGNAAAVGGRAQAHLDGNKWAAFREQRPSATAALLA